MWLLFLHLSKTIAYDKIVDTTVVLRNNLDLECIYHEEGTVIQFVWSKVVESSEERICSIHAIYGKDITKKYKDRVMFLNDHSSSDASLRLTDTSENDTGIYYCYITTLLRGTVKKLIEVRADDFGDITASSHRAFRTNEIIYLNFQCILKANVTQIVIKRHSHGKMETIAFCNDEVHTPRYGINDIKHISLDCLSLCNVTLIIQNFTSKDVGLYICNLTTEKGNEVTVVKVSKAAVFAIIAIIIITTLCIKRKHKHEENTTLQSKLSFRFKTSTNNSTNSAIEEDIYANM
ncbi:hypothetical protein XELAEV_18033560mg [Xenopus laevis]|uniref:Ig-like domain-containing protein n=1 Tax=Xenopus laevis TaxID=8355 RepID=A0A974CJG3_XENLA|nr:hypothetical protein XELAEV_18033560mg [Xenopus laevis]